MENLFPIFINLQNRRILIIGGGKVALEKLVSLEHSGAEITVISRDFSEDFLSLASRITRIQLLQRDIKTDDIHDYFIVFAATNNSILNRELLEYSQTRIPLFNSVDDPANSHFFSASVVRRGPYTLAISTNGKFPGLSKTLRIILDNLIPSSHSENLNTLTNLRLELKAKIGNPEERKIILSEIIKDIKNKYFAIKGINFLN